MWCTECGKQLPDDSKFCEFCGTKVEPVVTEAEPVVAEPVVAEPVAEEAAVETPVVEEPVVEPVDVPAAEEPVYTPPVYTPPVYTPPVYTPQPENVVNVRLMDQRPHLQLPTHRGLGKMFFLSILTFGIYPMVIYSRIVTELNIAASRHDGERTMPFFGMLMLAPITLFIYALVWIHGLCRRIGTELQRRGLNYRFGAASFWLWNVLGSLIIVGPFVFIHKMMKSMNKINADFNERG